MGPFFRLKSVLFMAWLQKVQEPLLFLIGTKSPLLDFIKRGVESTLCSPIGQNAESLGVRCRRLYLTRTFPFSGVKTVCCARWVKRCCHFYHLSHFSSGSACLRIVPSKTFLNLKICFWAPKFFPCLSLKASRWFPRRGWRGHSTVWCCFPVSSQLLGFTSFFF